MAHTPSTQSETVVFKQSFKRHHNLTVFKKHISSDHELTLSSHPLSPVGG